MRHSFGEIFDENFSSRSSSKRIKKTQEFGIKFRFLAVWHEFVRSKVFETKVLGEHYSLD